MEFISNLSTFMYVEDFELVILLYIAKCKPLRSRMAELNLLERILSCI